MVVPLTPRVAFLLSGTLTAALDRARRDGLRLHDEVVEAVDLIVRAGAEYRRAALASVDETSNPTPEADLEDLRDAEALDVADASRLLGLSEAYVRTLCRRGELGARRVGRTRLWQLDARLVLSESERRITAR